MNLIEQAAGDRRTQNPCTNPEIWSIYFAEATRGIHDAFFWRKLGIYKGLLIFKGCSGRNTLPKKLTAKAPENSPSQKETKKSSNHPFSGVTLLRC